ncbi:MAG: type II secretion system F family protein [Candidatus Pacebacteria bacterium]|nr:type II secretion system F family protein [Candidatus Paceibacterota bacterium]
MKFNYQSRDQKGKKQLGTIEASDQETALDFLQRQGLSVVSLSKSASIPFYNREIKLFQRISRKEIVLFSRQLSIMFRSQIPLLEILETLSFQTNNLKFKEIILKLKQEVESGATLSKALSQFPNPFSLFYVNMVRSGEASGKLSDSLSYLADHLEREYHLRSSIRGALIYPIFILFVLLLMGFFAAFFIMPDLVSVLKEGNGDLPLATSIVIGFTDFLKNKGWLILLFLVGLIVFIWQYKKTEKGEIFFDKFNLKLPLLNGFLKKIYLSRLAENLSTLIAGGLPIARALEISGRVVGNSIYRDIIFQTRDGVRKGENISAFLKKYPNFFPPMFIQMVVVGERTGRLDSALLNIVNFYQKEVDRAVATFIKLLEPALILFLGVMVAIFAIAILLPLFGRFAV